MSKMEQYKNLSRESGVTHYVLGKDFIKVKFKENSEVYVYNYSLNGKEHIENMKKLAIDGRGLSTYISQHPEVKNHYTRW
jgi:hypothetical protein